MLLSKSLDLGQPPVEIRGRDIPVCLLPSKYFFFFNYDESINDMRKQNRKRLNRM